MSAADLHALFGLFLDYGSSMATLVKIGQVWGCNSWALMLAAAYNDFPDTVAAEYSWVKKHYAIVVDATGEDDSSQLRRNLFHFARGLLGKHIKK